MKTEEILHKSYFKSNHNFTWLDIALLLFLSIYILSGVNVTPFHGDESTYILISEDYDNIVKKRDFTRVFFTPEGNSKQHLRLSIGSILPYSIGFARDLTDNNDSPRKQVWGESWWWGSSWDENIAMGNMPPTELLNLARTCSALMGTIGIILFFLTSTLLFSSRQAGWVATLVFATHADILLNIRRAMQEGPKFLFLILTIYIAVHILKSFQSKKTHRYLYILLGIASGFTLAAKQDVTPMLIAIYLALALIPIWNQEETQHIIINFLGLGVATIMTYAFFLILMPVFWAWWETALVFIGIAILLFQLPVWKNKQAIKSMIILSCILIIGMTIKSPSLWSKLFTPVISMIQVRETIVTGQLALTAQKDDAIQNKLLFFAETIFTSRAMYMEVASFDVPAYHQQIKTYEDSLLGGRIKSPFADILIIITAIIGSWTLIKRFKTESILIYSLFIITGVFLFLMIPLLWQRYFLIMQIPYALIVGAGGNQIWMWIKNLQTKKLPLV